MNNRISSLYCVFCDRHIKDVETIVSIGRSQIELGCLKRNDEDKVEYQEHDVIEELDLLYINTSGSYLDNNKRYYVFCKQCKLFVIKNFSQYNTHYDVDDFNRFYSNITLDVIKNIYHIYKQENKIEELKTFVKNKQAYFLIFFEKLDVRKIAADQILPSANSPATFPLLDYLFHRPQFALQSLARSLNFNTLPRLGDQFTGVLNHLVQFRISMGRVVMKEK